MFAQMCTLHAQLEHISITRKKDNITANHTSYICGVQLRSTIYHKEESSAIPLLKGIQLLPRHTSSSYRWLTWLHMRQHTRPLRHNELARWYQMYGRWTFYLGETCSDEHLTAWLLQVQQILSDTCKQDELGSPQIKATHDYWYYIQMHTDCYDSQNYERHIFYPMHSNIRWKEFFTCI